MNNRFDSISPLDFRYYGGDKEIFEKLSHYLSENANIKYQLKVEAALARALARKKVCSKEISNEIENACSKVTAEEVFEEELKTKHDIRALVNCIRNKISDKAKSYVHLTATSFDIRDTAEALRFKEFTNNVLIPELIELEKILIRIALNEKGTLQIGRTHGQHAEPITFGFAIACYVSRLGQRIIEISLTSNNLKGKFSGAVGAYNASALFFKNPEEFEAAVLEELDLMPSPTSTQIVEPEFMVDFIHSAISAFGVLADLSDDMRHLQRTEIAEISEYFGEKQVGSSTMPHKRNPISFENVKSLWKEFMPRIITVYSDQISEHQRDLTNSASSRFIPEILSALYIASKRLSKTLGKLHVDKTAMKKNFELSKNMIIAEPLYVLLASYGHPNAHEYVKNLTQKAEQKKTALGKLIFNDKNLKPYLKKFSKVQIEILKNPEKYTGIASKKTEKICLFWKKELGC